MSPVFNGLNQREKEHSSNHFELDSHQFRTQNFSSETQLFISMLRITLMTHPLGLYLSNQY